MARYAKWERPVQDQQGNLLNGVWTRVRREELAGNPNATLYADRNGAVIKDNPFYTAEGEPFFHAAGGPLWIEVYGAGYDKEWRYVPLGLGGESDITGLNPMGLWSSLVSYSIGDLVTAMVSSVPHLYASLQDSNLNQSPDTTVPIADTAYWMHLGVAASQTKTGLYVALGDEVTPVITRSGFLPVRNYGNWEVGEVRSSLTVPSSSGLVTVDIKVNGISMLSTPLSIDAGEKTSKTAATPAVISNTTVPDDSEITYDVLAAGTNAVGLKVTIAALDTQ